MIGGAIREFFVKYGIGPCPIVAAVSGGVDSTALLLALADLRCEGYAVSAAHVNHHLRGTDSDADEAFVRDLCARLEVGLSVADGTLDAAAVRDRGVEAAAREVRYTRLRELAGTRLVATAHQRDDQAETVLMRLLTGSGIAGLRGIHPVRGDGFVRPLLEVTRAQIDAFLRERNVVPRLDRSNEDPRFLRNRVRAIVRDLDAAGNLAAAAAQAREQWPVLERLVDEAEPAAIEGRWPAELWIREALLGRLVRRLDPRARDFDASRLAAELQSVKRASISKSVELVRRGESLFVERRTQSDPVPEFELELTTGQPLYVPEAKVTLAVHRLSAPPALHGDRQSQQFQLPKESSSPFVVRNRRPGDRFQPLGLDAPKKLKDFLIDRKVPAEQRDRLPLLVWRDQIVWVVGVEVSELFKVRPGRDGDLFEASVTASAGRPPAP